MLDPLQVEYLRVIMPVLQMVKQAHDVLSKTGLPTGVLYLATVELLL